MTGTGFSGHGLFAKFVQSVGSAFSLNFINLGKPPPPGEHILKVKVTLGEDRSIFIHCPKITESKHKPTYLT